MHWWMSKSYCWRARWLCAVASDEVSKMNGGGDGMRQAVVMILWMMCNGRKFVGGGWESSMKIGREI